jgi:hypothetical protein
MVQSIMLTKKDRRGGGNAFAFPSDTEKLAQRAKEAKVAKVPGGKE